MGSVFGNIVKTSIPLAFVLFPKTPAVTFRPVARKVAVSVRPKQYHFSSPRSCLNRFPFFIHFFPALKLSTAASQFAKISCKVFTLTPQSCKPVFSAFDVARPCSNVVPGAVATGTKQASDLTTSGTPSPQGTILVVNTVGVPQAASKSAKVKTKVFIKGFLQKGVRVVF